MIEFSGDGKVHGDELLDAAVVASTGSRFLQRTLYGFDAAVVLPGLEAAKDAGQVGGDRSGKTLEGFEWAVPNPAETAWEKRLGFVRRSGRGTDGTQGLLDALGASHLESIAAASAKLAISSHSPAFFIAIGRLGWRAPQPTRRHSATRRCAWWRAWWPARMPGGT